MMMLSLSLSLCVCVCVCFPTDRLALPRASEQATEKKKCDSMRYIKTSLVKAIWIDQKAFGFFFSYFSCEKSEK